MNTIRLYRQNVYLKEAMARITSIAENQNHTLITLNQTIFFPAGGGQSCDKGTIAGHPVLDVYEKEGEIFHLLDCRPSALPTLEESAEVELLLDWPHRFDNMQRHCGEHILSGIFFREFGGVNRGFHMGEQYMTIDIALEEKPEFTKLTWDMAKHAEFCANQVIWSDAPVISRYFETKKEAQNLPLRKALDIEEDITIVCVGNPDNPADCVACCGTHPSSAGQVGMIKILKVESNKGMFRVYLEAGERAFRKYQQEYNTLLQLGNQLSAGPEDLLQKYRAQQEKNQQSRNQLYALKRRVIEKETVAILKEFRQTEGLPLFQRNLTRYYDILTLDDLMNLAKELFHEIPNVLFLVHRPSHTVLLCSGGTPDCGRLVKENASVYGGKGGGNANAARAIFSKEEYVSTFIDLIEKHLR